MDRKNDNQMHSGHRQRMMESYLKTGAAGFSDVQLLEFLLAFAIPRRDTNPIAHKLLDEYGDLYRIMEAPVEQLMKLDGIGERSAVLLHFVGEYYLRAQRASKENEKCFKKTDALGKYLTTWFGALREEHAVLMCLDANCRMLDCREICVGTVNQVNLPYRRVVEVALNVNATSVVLAHNHTNGGIYPSREDIVFTEGLKNALDMFGIALADHFVIHGEDYFSMHTSRMI